MSDPKHVLIGATREDCAGKLRAELDDPTGVECYWRVSGAPRQTARGQYVYFEADGDVWGIATVLRVEDGRLWFTPIREIDALAIELPVSAPTRGFRYVPGGAGVSEESEQQTRRLQTGWWGNPYHQSMFRRMLSALVPLGVKIIIVLTAVLWLRNAAPDLEAGWLALAFVVINMWAPANPWTFRGRVLEVLRNTERECDE